MEIVDNKINKDEFQKEQDQLLYTLLDLRFFQPWRGVIDNNIEVSIQEDSHLELYITNTCNQHCSYCYLTKYPNLYPSNCNNEETIIKNLKILCEYIIANNFHIRQLDLFSGEIWHLPFGIKILSTILEYIKKGLIFKQILIPSNCSFVMDDVQYQKIQNLINEYMQNGVVLNFSISIDGKIVDNLERQRNDNTLYTDEFYDKIFTFAKMNNYYFHPMLAAKTAKYWIENYKWWIKQFDYYEMNVQTMMILEVRNNDWEDEDLKAYCDVLRFMADHFLKINCNGNINIMARLIGCIRADDDLPPLDYNYYPWSIPLNNDVFGCTVNDHLTIRLGDLAICPCHRTAYDKYIYGYFNVEDNMITGIRANNPYVAIKILMGSTQSAYPTCNQCPYNLTCMKGCLGAQIETQSDPFFPIKNVCHFYDTKITFLIKYYREKGIIDYLKTINQCEYYTDLVKYLLFLDRVVYEREQLEANNQEDDD